MKVDPPNISPQRCLVAILPVLVHFGLAASSGSLLGGWVGDNIMESVSINIINIMHIIEIILHTSSPLYYARLEKQYILGGGRSDPISQVFAQLYQLLV
jgi:hypothetical protein